MKSRIEEGERYVFHWTLDPDGDDVILSSNEKCDNSVEAYARLVKVNFSHFGSEVPLLNLENGETSVPHTSYVETATHNFYTLTANIRESSDYAKAFSFEG